MNKSLGRALLLEHLPHIQYKQSAQGVLLIIFSNGDAFFYPLNEHTKGNSPSVLKSLTNDTPHKKMSRTSLDKYDPSTKGLSSSSTSTKPCVYDVALSPTPDLHKVYSFNFGQVESDAYSPPRRLLLSPDKSLLLVIGVIHDGRNSLVVYQIVEGNAVVFAVVFCDLAFTFLDACFSHDSKTLVSILARYPSNIFLLALGIDSGFVDTQTSKAAPVVSDKGLHKSGTTSTSNRGISNTPRKVGPIAIIGPAISGAGHPYKMTHIIGNHKEKDPQYSNGCDIFHYATWNDDCGEFCLWVIRKSADGGNITYDWAIRHVPPGVPKPEDGQPNRDATTKGTMSSPRCSILEMLFCPQRGTHLLALVRRENYAGGKVAANGIGIQVFTHLVLRPHSEIHKEDSLNEMWYQLTENFDRSDILSVKWSDTFLIGTTPSAAVVVKGKGLCEVVDGCFVSIFQQLYDTFIQELCNFAQVGRFHRFWLNWSGVLQVIVVNPQTESVHPEWSDLFNGKHTQQELIGIRMLGRRIGYFINDIRQLQSELANTKRDKKKDMKDTNFIPHSNMTGLCCIAGVLVGMHLFHCSNCTSVLMRPLVCGFCRSATYCNKECQQEHWRLHIEVCSPHFVAQKPVVHPKANPPLNHSK